MRTNLLMAAMVLPRGFPSCSVMSSGTVPLLADRHDGLAPADPGFGLGDAPPPARAFLPKAGVS